MFGVLLVLGDMRQLVHRMLPPVLYHRVTRLTDRTVHS